MKHAAHVRMTHDDVHGVTVCLTLVDDHGQLQRLGQLKLLPHSLVMNIWMKQQKHNKQPEE